MVRRRRDVNNMTRDKKSYFNPTIARENVRHVVMNYYNTRDYCKWRLVREQQNESCVWTRIAGHTVFFFSKRLFVSRVILPDNHVKYHSTC